MHRIPNILSSLRILLSPIFLLLFFQDDFWLKAIGLAIYIVAAVTDYFDGYFARKYQTESDFGMFLDPLADKFLTFSGFIVLPFIAPSQFPWWAIILIIIRDVAVTLLRLYSKRKKAPMTTRFTAKAKTTIQMIFLYIGLTVGLFKGAHFFAGTWIQDLLNTDILFYLMLFVTFVTIYSGLEYIFVNRAVFKTSPSE